MTSIHQGAWNSRHYRSDPRPVFWYTWLHVASGETGRSNIQALDRAEFERLLKRWNASPIVSPGGQGWKYEALTAENAK